MSATNRLLGKSSSGTPPDGSAAEASVVDENTAERLLVERAQKGDVVAFESLYRSHLGRIYALCLRMTGSEHEAEEMAQEAFIRAWEKLSSFRHQSAFGSWLHRLAVNVVLVRWRSRRRRRDRVVAWGEVSAATDVGLEDVAARQQRPAPPPVGLDLDLEKAIAGLPAGARMVFVLHDIEGYRHREIADLTGLKEGTSKAQLHRARKLLRECLA